MFQQQFNTKKLPPITKRKEKRSAKIAEKSVLYADYRKLKDEVGRIETVKRHALKIIGRDEPNPDEFKQAKMRGRHGTAALLRRGRIKIKLLI
ncbi:MAG: hypothetical protein LBU32_07820 [Clostridiales bacterium]|nr:hypothetical protein [Clostridiales bacterium]